MANDKTFDRHINIWINGKQVENSMKAINKAYYQSRNELAGMTKNTKEWHEQFIKTAKLKKIVDEQNASLRTSTGLWDKLKGYLPIASFAALGAKVIELSKELFNLSKRMEADSRRANIVFGSSLNYVQEEASKLAKKMGVTNKEFVAMAAATGDLLVPLGFTRDQAAKMSVELQTLTGALDEWTGGSLGAAEISNILTKAMLGENEQLKQLGIAIRLDSDEYKDLVKEKLKIPGVTKAQAQALAELQLIQQKSLDAQTAYNQEGNKMLRIQKGLGAGWRSLKEDIVELFKADTIDKLKAEGQMVTALTSELYNLNTPQERRLQIYKQLKEIAPDIVKSLDDEMRATLSTKDALIEYNKQLINKIILAKKDKEIEKEREAVAKATEQRLMVENSMIASIQKAAQQQPANADRINEILAKSTSVIEKMRELKALGISIEDSIISPTGKVVTTNFMGDLEYAIEKEQELLDKLNNILDQRDNLSKRLGIGGASGQGGTGSGPNNPVTPSPTKNNQSSGSKSDNKATSDLISNSFDNLTDYSGSSSLKYDPDASMNASEKQLEVEKKINDARAKDFQDTEDEKVAALIAAGVKGTEEAKKTWANILAAEQAELDQHIETYEAYAQQIGIIIGEAIASGDNILKEAAKQLLLFAIDQLTTLARVYEKQAFISSIAKYGIVVGTIRAGAITLMIEAALAAARGIISKNMWTGGYTGDGGKHEPAGIVHKGEWVANADMVASPNTGPIIRALENSRLNRGYSTGGMVDNVTLGSGFGSVTGAGGGSSSNLVEVLQNIDKTNKRLNSLLSQLREEGVITRFDYIAVDNIRKGMKVIDKIEDGATPGTAKAKY